MGNKPISAGRAKTGTYVGENRKLDSMCRVKGLQECAQANSSVPTAQLQITMVVLGVIAHRKWHFRAMGVSRAFFEVWASKTWNLRETSTLGGKGEYSLEATETAVWSEYRL